MQCSYSRSSFDVQTKFHTHINQHKKLHLFIVVIFMFLATKRTHKILNIMVSDICQNYILISLCLRFWFVCPAFFWRHVKIYFAFSALTSMLTSYPKTNKVFVFSFTIVMFRPNYLTSSPSSWSRNWCVRFNFKSFSFAWNFVMA